MYRRRSFRLIMHALIPIAAISLGYGDALAQSPAAGPGASPPAADSKPGAPPTPAPGTPAPSTPAAPPAAAETPAPPPAAAPAPVQTADAFGEEITLEPKTVVVLKGTANWDSAFDTLIESFKSLSGRGSSLLAIR